MRNSTHLFSTRQFLSRIIFTLCWHPKLSLKCHRFLRGWQESIWRTSSLTLPVDTRRITRRTRWDTTATTWFSTRGGYYFLSLRVGACKWLQRRCKYPVWMRMCLWGIWKSRCAFTERQVYRYTFLFQFLWLKAMNRYNIRTPITMLSPNIQIFNQTLLDCSSIFLRSSIQKSLEM